MGVIETLQELNADYNGMLGVSIIITIFLTITMATDDPKKALMITTITSAMLTAVGLVAEPVTLGLIMLTVAAHVLKR